MADEPGSTAAPAPAPTSIPAPGPPAWSLLHRLVIPLLAISLVVILVLLATDRWSRWFASATVQTTNDATVRAQLSRIGARVSGNVVHVAVQDFQQVRAGDLLLQIDPADYEAALAQAEAGVAQAQASLDNLENQKALQRAVVVQAEAQHVSAAAREVQARLERDRQQSLLSGRLAGTAQKAEQSVADYEKAAADSRASTATIDAQRRQLDVLAGQQLQLAASLHAAEAARKAAQLRLAYTRITAPFDGVVGERQVQDGDYVTVGSSLVALVPLPQVYVVANYKETQLTNVSAGQRVEITVDMLPGVVLRGHVGRLSPASGSTFALLPPDNATGNFTKVVQRLPVRIEFEPGQPMLARLRPGMSVVTRIQVETQQGERSVGN